MDLIKRLLSSGSTTADVKIKPQGLTSSDIMLGPPRYGYTTAATHIKAEDAMTIHHRQMMMFREVMHDNGLFRCIHAGIERYNEEVFSKISSREVYVDVKFEPFHVLTRAEITFEVGIKDDNEREVLVSAVRRIITEAMSVGALREAVNQCIGEGMTQITFSGMFKITENQETL